MMRLRLRCALLLARLLKFLGFPVVAGLLALRAADDLLVKVEAKLTKEGLIS